MRGASGFEFAAALPRHAFSGRSQSEHKSLLCRSLSTTRGGKRRLRYLANIAWSLGVHLFKKDHPYKSGGNRYVLLPCPEYIGYAPTLSHGQYYYSPTNVLCVVFHALTPITDGESNGPWRVEKVYPFIPGNFSFVTYLVYFIL